jgi:hypothetical protein
LTLYHFSVYPEAGMASYWAKEALTEEEARVWLFQNHPNFAQGHRITVEVDPPLEEPPLMTSEAVKARFSLQFPEEITDVCEWCGTSFEPLDIVMLSYMLRTYIHEKPCGDEEGKMLYRQQQRERWAEWANEQALYKYELPPLE